MAQPRMGVKVQGVMETVLEAVLCQGAEGMWCPGKEAGPLGTGVLEEILLLVLGPQPVQGQPCSEQFRGQVTWHCPELGPVIRGH